MMEQGGGGGPSASRFRAPVLPEEPPLHKAAESPQPIAPVCAAPISTSGLSDVAATMARLEQRLHAMAAEVADLIGHVEQSRARS